MSHTQTVTVECHQAGQPRPYADTIYESTLTFSWRPHERVVRQVATAVMVLGAAVANDKSVKENWAQPYFDFVRDEGEGNWRVRIIRPYDD